MKENGGVKHQYLLFKFNYTLKIYCFMAFNNLRLTEILIKINWMTI